MTQKERETAALRKVRETDFSRVAYRGYLIRRNDLTGLMWVEKDGQPICYPFCWDDARKQIDSLLD
jgi:hypothetical protein